MAAPLPDRMFVPQITLESWLDAGTADMEGRAVVVRATGERYHLESAVRFIETIPGRESSALLDRIATEAEVVAAGGELLGDSVLFGDAGFVVEPGFVAVRA